MIIWRGWGIPFQYFGILIGLWAVAMPILLK